MLFSCVLLSCLNGSCWLRVCCMLDCLCCLVSCCFIVFFGGELFFVVCSMGLLFAWSVVFDLLCSGVLLTLCLLLV